MRSGIYKIINLINNKIYIGSAINFNHRRNQHFESLKGNCHRNSKLQNSYNKHNANNFVFEVIEYVEDLTKLIEREQYYIDTLKPEYNICQIAGSQLGLKRSDETKKKISEANKGRIAHNKGISPSNESKLKMSASAKIKIFSENHRRNLGLRSKKRINTKHSDETKKKISEANKGRIAHNKGKISLNKGRKFFIDENGKRKLLPI